MNDGSNPSSASCVVSFQWRRGLFNHHAVGGFTTVALPTISISESPGIHSRAMQARDGALPGEKISPVDLVQRLVLRFMSIEACLAGWYEDAVGERQAEEDLEMDDAVHSAAGTLDGLLEGVHGAGDVLFERVSYEDMILFGVAVVGTGSGNVVDPVVGVVGAGPTSRISARCASGRGCASSRGLLLTENFQRAGDQSCHRRGLAEEVASGVDFHGISPSDVRPIKT